MTIEEHFSIYDKTALKVTDDSLSVYKHIADRLSDKTKLKDLIDVSKIALDAHLSAVFADLFSKTQPQNIQAHYQNANLQPVIDAYLVGFEKDCVLYLKNINKYI
jgi:hypothetical protein